MTLQVASSYRQYSDGGQASLDGVPGVDPHARLGGLVIGRFTGDPDVVQLTVYEANGRTVVDVYVAPEVARRLADQLIQAANQGDAP